MLFTTISNKFFKAFRRNTRRCLPSHNRLPRRLVVEQLEDRTCPSSLAFSTYLGGPGDDQGTAIAVDAAGNVYATGGFSGTVDFDPGPGVFNLTSAGGYDAFVSKLDGAGNFVWARALGSSTDDGNGIAVDGAGNVYTTGAFQGTADFD